MLLAERELDWRGDPVSVLRRWPVDRPVSLLHSGRFDPRWARWSVLAEPTEAVRCDLDEGDRPRCRRLDASSRVRDAGDDPWAMLHELEADGNAAWIGYLAYDLGRCIETLPRRALEDRGWPAMQWQRCPGWAVHDGESGMWHAGGTWAERPPVLLSSAVQHAFGAGELVPCVEGQRYVEGVRRVIEYIAAGDVFQVNLAQRLTAAFHGSPRAFYAALAEVSPAWYGALIELLPFHDQEPRRSLASTSPELFLEVVPDPASGHRRVTTRPIKGTRPAHAPDEELRHSAKDAAELAMIVDLLRNDLGRVASFGSIRVEEPRTIEHHPTIQHATATVTGRLPAPCTLADLLRATLPGGSITGAPKVRAMEIIDELEPFRRGPYCGSIGLIHGRTARLNIAIRTAAIEQTHREPGRLDAWVGAGIVADSDPVAEHEETLVKARAIGAALEKAAPLSRTDPHSLRHAHGSSRS
ncbi:MAG: anthranilate synthase component I family protein [Phycisphaeraceae bacterium]